MSKHTPGPWHVSENRSGLNIEVGAERSCSRPIAFINFRRTGAARGQAVTYYAALEDLPNARLIAAAPELLAALRYLCAHVEAAPEITRLDLQDVLRAVREGRAAIAKAEGA